MTIIGRLNSNKEKDDEDAFGEEKMDKNSERKKRSKRKSKIMHKRQSKALSNNDKRTNG